MEGTHGFWPYAAPQSPRMYLLSSRRIAAAGGHGSPKSDAHESPMKFVKGCPKWLVSFWLLP